MDGEGEAHLIALACSEPPSGRKYWSVHLLQDRFVKPGHDVLEIYKLPYAANRPVICMDEMPKQLLAEQQEPIPGRAGEPARQDYEYKRNGVADLFMVFEPLQGKRFAEVTEKRRKI